ncbi:MAG: hypothetical protein VKK04_19190 [Synechococcales bacterium]|nr:hypothetical protein [Synechococcales bacterium]
MSQATLTPCASLLYYWLKLHSRTHQSLRFDFQFDSKNFQAWTGEFLETSVSLAEVHASLEQLSRLKLVKLDGNYVTLVQNHSHRRVRLHPLPRHLLPCHRPSPWLMGAFISLVALVMWSGISMLSSPSTTQDTDPPLSLHPFTVLGE